RRPPHPLTPGGFPMPTTQEPRIDTAHTTVPLEPGTVLVANTLLLEDGTKIPCPAATLLEGEIHRRGAHTTPGTRRTGRPDDATKAASSGPVALVRTTGKKVGLGAAAREETGTTTAHEAVNAWPAACEHPRTALLAAPRSFCAGVDRAIEIVERALK